MTSPLLQVHLRLLTLAPGHFAPVALLWPSPQLLILLAANLWAWLFRLSGRACCPLGPTAVAISASRATLAASTPATPAFPSPTWTASSTFGSVVVTAPSSTSDPVSMAASARSALSVLRLRFASQVPRSCSNGRRQARALYSVSLPVCLGVLVGLL